MTCYHPLDAWQRPSGGALVFKKTPLYRKLQIPCGQCIGCRLEYSRQWAIRCVHESQLHDDNCFVTLTYSDEHLPVDRSLCLKHFQLFFKRLRKKINRRISYYHCGEYGECCKVCGKSTIYCDRKDHTYEPGLGRPHYHACIFGHDFGDKKLWTTRNGVKLYVSQELDTLWGLGYATIGEVTFESAAYVARYIAKKINGTMSTSHYELLVQETGEIVQRKKEYATMSRRPAIAELWFAKNLDDVYPRDHVVVRGKETKPPRYYDKLYNELESAIFTTIKERREEDRKSRKENNTKERLAVREICKKAQLRNLKRTLD